MRSLSILPLTAIVLLAGSVVPSSLRAEERVVYYAEPTGNNDNFFHRVGQFFRDLFPTEQSLSPRPTPPQPTAPRYNLDLPPPGTGYGRSYGTHHVASDYEQQAVNSTEQTKAITHSAATKAATGKRATPTVSSTEAAAKTTETPKPPKKKEKVAPETVQVSSEPVVTERTTTVTTTPSKTKVTTSENSEILTGTRTSKTTRVKSPYPPYNELDVSGLPSGSLAQDPTTQKIFRVP